MSLKTHIAEVGFPHAHTDISLTGIEFNATGIEVPRLVLFEPEGYYQPHHEEYATRVRQVGGEIYKGNIYEPESLTHLPPIGLLVLENVLTDPSFEDKDWQGLADLLGAKVIVNGIILMIDHAIVGMNIEFYDLLRKIIVKSTTLEIILDAMFPHPGLNDESLVGCLLNSLNHIDIVDEALVKGLKTIDPIDKHILVLKRQ